MASTSSLANPREPVGRASCAAFVWTDSRVMLLLFEGYPVLRGGTERMRHQIASANEGLKDVVNGTGE